MTDSGNGGPMGPPLFYNLYMWNQAFQLFNMGYAIQFLIKKTAL